MFKGKELTKSEACFSISKLSSRHYHLLEFHVIFLLKNVFKCFKLMYTNISDQIHDDDTRCTNIYNFSF